ncbi:N-6 DNA methylase [Epilithonimonas sp.]|uniref:type I restriction-modification system subunit M n=1 Tax=Epilithonimonas sp. TaxID=2894511 RepID=UPI00289FC7CA|nr:N-6 DNA methylase [Epilithonimonas sp.]
MTNKELNKLKNDLWSAATKMRSDSDLKLNEIDTPLLGLIFLKFADNKYKVVESEILFEIEAQKNSRRQRHVYEIAIEKCGFYLPEKARYNYLLNLPEEADIAKAIKDAMDAIESYKPELKDVLPKDEYFALARIDNSLLKTLLKNFSDIPENATGDIFGKIYEFFLGKFALSEGQGGGEFYTPTSVVKYMVEVIEPFQGTVFDPACGSGGMFVQCSNFIDQRKQELNNNDEKDLFVYGSEKTLATVNLAKMNIVVNGLRGDIKQANAYYEDPHNSFGKFDFVMANPPFNVKDVNYDRVKEDIRFKTYGIPQNKTKSTSKKEGEVTLVPNANYMWINLFATSLKPNGRAALVMPNSASDARNSEKDIREKLIKAGLISQMVTLTSNLFSTVTLPASLWFFDKSQEITEEEFESEKENIKILFIDARNIYYQIDRAHREFTQEQIWNLGIITHLYNGKENDYLELVDKYLHNISDGFPDCLRSYQTFFKTFNEFKIAFTNWFKKSEFTKVQKEKIKTENFEELLNAELDDNAKYEESFKQAETSLKSFLKQADATNESQLHIAEDLTAFEDEKKHTKKEFEKAFRTIEKAYKFAEKELKDKTDKLWKDLPNIKNVKTHLDAFIEFTNPQINREAIYTDETEGKSSIYYLKQIQWLQERFPEGKYEDVIGLCKVANYAEVEEQDFSLNSGRYVGVVIEEDGMTEDEFEITLKNSNQVFVELSKEANLLSSSINNNIETLFKP